LNALFIWAASALMAVAVAAASFKGAGAAAAPPLSARARYGLGGPPGWSIAGLNALFIWAASALTFWLLPGGFATDVLVCADFPNPHTHVPNVAAVMSSLYLSQAHAAHPASLLDSAIKRAAPDRPPSHDEKARPNEALETAFFRRTKVITYTDGARRFSNRHAQLKGQAERD
jgi:hypothetical protein